MEAMSLVERCSPRHTSKVRRLKAKRLRATVDSQVTVVTVDVFHAAGEGRATAGGGHGVDPRGGVGVERRAAPSLDCIIYALAGL